MNPKLKLLKALTLPDFPSGSSINFYDGKLFLIGDDASHILVLDVNYQKVDAIHLFDSSAKRISKPEKADFETSTVLVLDGKDYLLVLGSGSRKNRMSLILVNLKKEWGFESFNYREFIKRIKEAGIEEVNIECATVIGDHFLLGNRGNTENPKNLVIVTDIDFWQRQNEVPIAIAELELTVNSTTFIGISELCYAESQDILLFTLSTELTGNSYEDGTIGDSYIGWINSASQKINEHKLKLDGMINLLEVDPEFTGEKVEGLCIEFVSGSECILHLISDNDQGQSKLFKVGMSYIPDSNDLVI